MAAVERGGLEAAFSATKRQLLLDLKRRHEASLEDLATALGISKMAVHKHLAQLENRGFVEHTARRHGVGRPRLYYRLAEHAQVLFPKAYGQMAVCAFRYVEQKAGQKAVIELLKQRQAELFGEYRRQLVGKPFLQQVQALAHIRDRDGYLAEARPLRRGSMELLEHNCPVLEIASRYGEACAVERELFSMLLDAEVETSHRAAVGDPVCRFVIRPRHRGDGL